VVYRPTVRQHLISDEITDWTPLWGRGRLFPEDLDPSDPWQFRTFRVV
jgi:homospermidine synthase